MKLKYIIGVLVCLLAMAGTASAQQLNLNINQHGDIIPYIGTSPGYQIFADYSGNTVHIYAVGDTHKEFSMHRIFIESAVPIDPAGYPGWTLHSDRDADSIDNFHYEFMKNGNTDVDDVTFTFNSPISPACSPNGYAIAVQLRAHNGGGNGAFYTSKCPTTPIPEFPSIALPIAAIMGIMFVIGSRKKE